MWTCRTVGIIIHVIGDTRQRVCWYRPVCEGMMDSGGTCRSFKRPLRTCVFAPLQGNCCMTWTLTGGEERKSSSELIFHIDVRLSRLSWTLGCRCRVDCRLVVNGAENDSTSTQTMSRPTWPAIVQIMLHPPNQRLRVWSFGPSDWLVRRSVVVEVK